MRIPYSISKSGLKAQQNKLDTIAHNIANSNTAGYKQKTVSFRELLVNDINEQDALLSANAENLGLNRGVLSSTNGTDFSTGSLIQSEENLSLSVNGEGFFGVQDGNGNLVLTRDGNFTLDGNKQIVNSRGQVVETNLTIPADAWPEGEVQVGSSGEIFIQTEEGQVSVGVIPLYNVENPQALIPIGDNNFTIAPDQAGTLINSVDNPAAFGTLLTGAYENSNVDLAQSLTDMIMAQRAYSLNAQVTKSTDEIYSLINQFT